VVECLARLSTVSHLPRRKRWLSIWDCGLNSPLQRKRDRIAPSKVPMLELSNHTVLIVDFAGACRLREHLLSTGVRVHVINPAAALIWARCKKIDAAFISIDDASTALCEQLKALGVRPIIVTADDASGFSSASTSWRAILRSRASRRAEPADIYLN